MYEDLQILEMYNGWRRISLGQYKDVRRRQPYQPICFEVIDKEKWIQGLDGRSP
jgi:hypothetical protein